VTKLIIILLLLAGCTKEPTLLPEHVTYTQHIEPLFQQKCSPCHSSNISSLNFMNYSNVYYKRETIKYRVLITKDMPKGLTMTEYQRQMVGLWVDQGGKK